MEAEWPGRHDGTSKHTQSIPYRGPKTRSVPRPAILSLYVNFSYPDWIFSLSLDLFPPSTSPPSSSLSLLRNLPSCTPTLCSCHVVICASCSRFWLSPVVTHRKRFSKRRFEGGKKSLCQITLRPQSANGVQTSCQTTYYRLAPQTTQHNANSLHEFWPLQTPQLISLQQKQRTENLSFQAGLTKKQKKKTQRKSLVHKSSAGSG